MKSIPWVVSVVVVLASNVASASDQPDPQTAKLDAIKAELRPLRERAYLEPDVIAARKKLDAAYRDYWDAVRVAMVRLDPTKKKLVANEIVLRKKTSAVSSGSRAEDYEKKAAKAKAEPTPKKSEKTGG